MKSTNNAALWIFLFLLVLSLGACNQLPGAVQPQASATAEPPTAIVPTAATVDPSPPGEALLSTAAIESLEVINEDQTSGQTSVRLRGILSNNCAIIDDIVSKQEGNSFNITVLTIEEQGADCSEESVPFEEIVVLDISGLDSGSYDVVADDRQVSFDLAAEEIQEPIATAEIVQTEETAAAPPTTASISGLIWHDSCANAALDDSDLPAGCVLNADDTFLADGLLQDEEGIGGVEVAIGEGECPATAVDTDLTDDQGAYTFSDLAAGAYCVFIDMTRTQNQGILEAGSWSAPGENTPQITTTLDSGDVQEDINFGWDYLELPLAAADLTGCTNSLEFVADLTVPDDTPFPAGESFTKQWQLRNNGTCPWSADYSIVFVGGDLMSAAENIALDQVVAPGEELEVSIDMTAPEEPGTYRGNWQIADAGDEPFGVDGIIEDAFWLQIVVSENVQPESTPLPNSALLSGAVWDDFCLNSDPGQGCVEFPEGSGIYVGDGTFGPGESPLSDILIALADGACPTDGTFPKDSTLVESTLTDAGGQYQFEDLSEGTYCVFMDALDEDMVDLLIPGNWTWPGTGVGQYTILLDPGEQILDLDFGWDFID